MNNPRTPKKSESEAVTCSNTPDCRNSIKIRKVESQLKQAARKELHSFLRADVQFANGSARRLTQRWHRASGIGHRAVDEKSNVLFDYRTRSAQYQSARQAPASSIDRSICSWPNLPLSSFDRTAFRFRLTGDIYSSLTV